MPKNDYRVDVYIAKSAGFAKPILKHIRKLVHEICPDVEETIKWQFPTFLHKGMLCSMAAFKEHCTFGFWKHSLITATDPANKKKTAEAMGQMGRITSLSDLPPDAVLRDYIKEAVRLNEEGVKAPRPPRPRVKKALIIPADLGAALKKTEGRGRLLKTSAPATKGNTSNGSPRQNARRRAPAGSKPRSNGSPKENRAIGNTRIADRLVHGARDLFLESPVWIEIHQIKSALRFESRNLSRPG